MMTSNEEQLAFYSEIGRAVTSWAHVEFSLASIIAACQPHDNTGVAVAGFLSIENFRSKLQFVDATMSRSGVLSATIKPDWTMLRERCERTSKRRNTIAHSWVITQLDARPGRRIKLVKVKPAHNPTPRDHFPGALCLRDIAAYRLEFFALHVAAENFHYRLRGLKELYPKHLEQEQPTPTLADLRRGLLAHAQPLQPPSRA